MEKYLNALQEAIEGVKLEDYTDRVSVNVRAANQMPTVLIEESPGEYRSSVSGRILPLSSASYQGMGRFYVDFSELNGLHEPLEIGIEMSRGRSTPLTRKIWPCQREDWDSEDYWSSEDFYRGAELLDRDSVYRLFGVKEMVTEEMVTDIQKRQRVFITRDGLEQEIVERIVQAIETKVPSQETIDEMIRSRERQAQRKYVDEQMKMKRNDPFHFFRREEYTFWRFPEST